MKKFFLLAIISTSLWMLGSKTIFAQWGPVPSLVVGTDTVTSVSSISGFGTKVYACSDKGLFESTDNGDTWNNISFTDPVTLNQKMQCVLVASNSDIYAGSDQRLYKSTNNGSSWTWLNSITDSLSFNSIAEINGNIVISYNIGFSAGGAYYSSDGGTSWNASTGLINLPMFRLLVDGSNLFMGGRNNVYKSTDNGMSWNGGTGFPPTCGPRIVVKSNGKFFAADVGGNGLYSSVDGTAWTSVDTSVFTPFCQVFALVEANGTIIATMDGACNNNDQVKASVDTGTTWNVFMNGLPDIFYPVLGRNSEGSCFFTFSPTEDQMYKICTAVGIDESTINERMIYPNPSSHFIMIDGIENADIRITNAYGQIVFVKTYQDEKIRINIENLDNGVYILNLNSKDERFSKKFIKS